MLAVTCLVLCQARALHTGCACEVFPTRVGTFVEHQRNCISQIGQTRIVSRQFELEVLSPASREAKWAQREFA